MSHFFVSLNGNDAGDGSLDKPFATLGRARLAAQQGEGDVNIHLRSGTYTSNEPWSFDHRDSAKDDHRILYQAFGWGTPEKEDVTVSNGRQITGFKEHDGVFEVNVGSLSFQQLYVNNRKANTASVSVVPGEWTQTPSGYTIDAPLHLQSPSSVQCVYSAIYPWAEARCNIASVDYDGQTTTVTMAQPAWQRALRMYGFCWDGMVQNGPPTPTSLENDRSFLTEPGNFVLNQSEPGQHVLFYKPLPGETLNNISVIAPVAEQVLVVDSVSNISFVGLNFACATWLQPRDGFLHFHGDGHYVGEGQVDKYDLGDDNWVMVPTKMSNIPPCIDLRSSSGLRFEHCRFTRLGGVALGADGCTDLKIQNCLVEDVSASGIVLKNVSEGTIEDTTVQRIGFDFPGSPGISLDETADCTVSHNTVTDTPHSGILLGPSRRCRIENNLITRAMGRLADGGGINLSGLQGESYETGAQIRNNYIEDLVTPYNFGIYPDYGSTWVTFEGNVVIGADSSAVFEVTPPMDHCTFRGNFFDKEPVETDSIPKEVTYEDNCVIKDVEKLRSVTGDIRQRAGARQSH